MRKKLEYGINVQMETIIYIIYYLLAGILLHTVFIVHSDNLML